jgi:hypothetical protein
LNSKLLKATIALVAATSLIAGCGEKVQTSQVSGVITVDGKPVGPSAVSFFAAGKGRPIATSTGGEGQYQIQLPLGDYKVVVVTSSELPAGWKEGDPVPPPRVAVPLSYAQPVTTPLTLQVTSTEPLTHDLALTSKQR